MRWWRTIRLTTWLTAGVLLLLPLLAALQFRWLSRIGDDATSRLRSVAENAARALSRDLSFEVLRAWRARAAQSQEAGIDDGDGVDTSIVLDALVLDRVEGAAVLRVRRWDLAANTCTETSWPPDVPALDDEIVQRIGPGRERDLGGAIAAVQRSISGLGRLVVPLAAERDRAGALTPPCPVSPPGVALVRLDDVALRERLLPELFRRHLDGLQGDFRFAIVDRAHDSDVVFAPPGTDAAYVVAAPDISVPIVLGRDGAARGGRDAREGGRGPRLDDRPERMRGADGDHHGRGGSGWTVIGRHRAGSLDSAVSRLRNRNLALSLGILALLGVAVATIAANARRAERLGQQQVEFVASVSHEMRTPVAAIDVAARNLEDGVVSDPARVRQYGGVIRTEARRLGETVERVLQVAALDAGRGPAALVPVDLRACVDEVVARARREHPRASVELEHDGSDAHVLADAAMLRSCVENLVGNALKYGGAPGWVRLRLGRTPGREGHVRLSVSDRGPGIHASDRGHLFEPFYRGHLAIERRLPGNGLGLHIVKRCMAAMGGGVELTETSPSGTTFTLMLPTADGERRS